MYNGVLCVCGELIGNNNIKQGGSLQPQKGGGGAGVAVKPCEEGGERCAEFLDVCGGVLGVHKLKIFKWFYNTGKFSIFRGVYNVGSKRRSPASANAFQ